MVAAETVVSNARSELFEIWSRSLSNVTLARLSCQEVKRMEIKSSKM